MLARGMISAAQPARRVLGRRGLNTARLQTVAALRARVSEVDPEIAALLRAESGRQRDSLVLIASENFAPAAVSETLASTLANKYSEGYPGARYYGGNEHIDKVESLCQARALAAFRLDPAMWGVNVQALSGSPANVAVYTALLAPHDRILSLDLPHGGHLSHGYAAGAGAARKRISAVSLFWETMPYRVSESTGRIDYDELERSADLFKPRMIVAGASAYARLIDYARMRKVADAQDAYLMSDMAHISGLVAGDAIPSPFPHSDIVTTTTHKSLRGPRGAMIFFRKGVRRPGKKPGDAPVMYDLESRINAAVFPGLQGGPHNHTIGALAVALKLAATPAFKEYAAQVVRNCKRFADALMKHGFQLVSGGTDNHLVLVDLRHSGIDGSRVERVCELAALTVNKNTVPGDKSAMMPSGIRMGTPALTSRGFDEEDFEQVANFFQRAVAITKAHKAAVDAKGLKKIAEFRASLHDTDQSTWPEELRALRSEVVAFARKFPTLSESS